MTPKQYFTRLLIILAVIMAALVFAYFNYSKNMTNIENPRDYQIVLNKANSIKEGRTMDEIRTLLGEPVRKEGLSWEYDFSILENVPKLVPGTQVFYGVKIDFDKEGKVTGTSFSWADKE